MVGNMIGLGDRHYDNQLLHLETMKISHIDFECLFEKGAELPVPERVPFRLTRNIIDGLGLTKEEGVFTNNCVMI